MSPWVHMTQHKSLSWWIYIYIYIRYFEQDYRPKANIDDSFIFMPESDSRKTSRIQKKILRAFKLLGFKNEIIFNLKVVNFLDITFNLSENSFKPFHKDKQMPSYINHIYPTPPLGQDMTQGQFLSGV